MRWTGSDWQWLRHWLELGFGVELVLLLLLLYSSWSSYMLDVGSVLLELWPIIHASKKRITWFFHHSSREIMMNLLFYALNQLVFGFLLVLHLQQDVSPFQGSGRLRRNFLQRHWLRLGACGFVRHYHAVSWFWWKWSLKWILKCICRFSIHRLPTGLELSWVSVVHNATFCSPGGSSVHNGGLHS